MVMVPGWSMIVALLLGILMGYYTGRAWDA